jgi:hypothetical protein
MKYRDEICLQKSYEPVTSDEVNELGTWTPSVQSRGATSMPGMLGVLTQGALDVRCAADVDEPLDEALKT